MARWKSLGVIVLLSAGSALADANLNTVVTFDRANNGANPLGNLIADSAGNLYGTTNTSGANGDGTVFEIAAGTHALTTLATFDGTNGANPVSGLIFDAAGDLYGTTTSGGPGGQGTVFEIAAGTTTLSTVDWFNFTYGASPGALTIDLSGNIYGVTQGGGANYEGTVFKITGGRYLSVIATFNNTNGSYPTGGLYVDGAGNVFGTTSQGGANNDGTVFEIPAGTKTVNTLVNFNGTNGSGPAGTLIADASGNLYGTTGYGGADNDGTVFKIAAGTDILTTLASLDGTQGEYPSAGLIADAAGNLYGTAFYGGSGGEGTVFELAAGASTLSTLAEFDGDNGAFPMAALLADSSGDLYGTTFEGGTDTFGTVFELTNTGFVVPEPGALGLSAVAGLVLVRRK